MNVEELRKLYSSNDAAKAFFEHMASRRNNQSETKLKRIIQLLATDGSAIKKSDLIATFRQLERLDCGQYVEGRHGWPSRFVWRVGSIGTCRAATGESAKVETLEPEEDEGSAETDMRTHAFNLRADLSIEFSLPVDISTTEAERVAAFVKTLPLEEYD